MIEDSVSESLTGLTVFMTWFFHKFSIISQQGNKGSRVQNAFY